MSQEQQPTLDSLQDRLNYLFREVRVAGRGRYSVREAADAIKQEFSSRGEKIDISSGYINHICTGARLNPGVQQVRALAWFFGVPATFLFSDNDDTERRSVVTQIAELHKAIELKESLDMAKADQEQHPLVSVVTAKARGVSTTNLANLVRILDTIRGIEGLPSDDAGNEQP